MLTSAYMDSVRYANSLVEMPLYSNQQALISRTLPSWRSFSPAFFLLRRGV